jgi:hypothetical protein
LTITGTIAEHVGMQTVIKILLMVSLTAWGLVFSPGICVSGSHEHECDEQHEHEATSQEVDCGFYCCDQTFIHPEVEPEFVFTGVLYSHETPGLEATNYQPSIAVLPDLLPPSSPLTLPLLN